MGGRVFLVAGWLMLVTWCDDVSAAGSGRAFPIDSENYVIKQFQSINPYLEWDQTNYLVDLSGRYANCKNIGLRGPIKVREETPAGATIAGYTDYTDGWASDVDSVNSYLRHVVDRWMKSGEVHAQLRLAQQFGCSVRPGCEGQVSISCMFSSDKPSNIIEEPEKPIHDLPEIKPRALAFTSQQYNLAEGITGNRWDRSHFLENLSGAETSCAMIYSRDWPFTKLSMLPEGLRGIGTYGHARNRGSTPEALAEILRGFKEIKYAKSVGCSVIPDCMVDGNMYVVVSCLYVE